MKRAALLLALLVLFSPYLGNTSQALAQCGTPVPTWTPVPTYEQVVLGVQSAHLLAYFPLNETSGTVADDITGLVGDGTYNGVTLNATAFVNGEPAPSFDGINDIVDIYSTALRDAFDEQEGSAMAWVKITNWADANFRGILRLGNGTSNNARMIKLNTGTSITLDYTANATTETLNQNTSSNTNWIQLVLTWSKTADTVEAFYDGSSIGTSNTLGTWSPSSALSGSYTVIGGNTISQLFFLGSIAHVAIWDTPLTSTDVTALYNVPSGSGPTPTVQPTCTPTATPTHSPTPTPTITPTADVDQYWTAPPPETTGTPEPGQPYKFSHSANAGQVVIVVFLAAILFTIWAVFLIARRRRQK